MAKRTQKAGASAKYGPRYGVSVRRRAASVLKKRSKKFTCPSCQYQKVSRTVAGTVSYTHLTLPTTHDV